MLKRICRAVAVVARAVAAVAVRWEWRVVEEVAAATDGPKAVAVPRAAVVRVVRMVMRTAAAARAAALATAVRVTVVGRAVVLAVVEAVEAAVVAVGACDAIHIVQHCWLLCTRRSNRCPVAGGVAWRLL